MGKLGVALQHFDTILDLVATAYGVSAGELVSTFKYRPLPAARQLIVYSLYKFGLKNGEISTITGYSPGRINYDLRAAEKQIKEIPYFTKMSNAIVSILQAGEKAR